MPSQWRAEPYGEENSGTPHKNIAIACCCVAITSLVPVALFQLKVLKTLPDPPGAIFDSAEIVTSKDAHKYGIPDGLLGIGSYGVTLTLLILAGPSRPLLQKALRSKLALDGTMAIRHAKKQVTQFGHICSWCMGAAIATAGLVYFARRSRVMEGAPQD